MVEQAVVEAVRRWVEEAVVGLDLCPFARPEVVNDRIRYVASDAHELEVLLLDVQAELDRLVNTSPEILSTTLVIVPHMLADFEAYLDVAAMLDDAIAESGLEGEIQIASFHPDYIFGGEPTNALSHYTNRAPYPVFHLLREADITRAVDRHPDIGRVPADNIARLEAMGRAAVHALFAAFGTQK